MASILEGLKVIEMGHFVAMPAAGAMMADWGAEVIKIEPLAGDALRHQLVVRKDLSLDAEGVNWRFEVHNRNKKSIALNLAAKSGREILLRLLKDADVFIANYELESLKKFGIDYTSIKQVNPRIIYGILTGYGARGPERKERGFDFTAGWARTGIQYLLADGDSPPPQNRPGVMDRIAGITVVAGIMAALLNREKTGKGREVEFSLYHTGVWVGAADMQMALTGNEALKNDRARVINPLTNTYRTKDNRWIQLAMLQIHLHLKDFCRAVGQPDLQNDPRFPAADWPTFLRNRHELILLLDRIFAGQTLDYWEKTLKEHNCIFSRVCTPEEVVKDRQARENDLFVHVDHPRAGAAELVNTPVTFSGDPVVIATSAPEIGEHTEELLLACGYTWEDIAKLKEEHAII